MTVQVEISATISAKTLPQAQKIIENLFALTSGDDEGPASRFDEIRYVIRKEKGAGCDGAHGTYFTGEVL